MGAPVTAIPAAPPSPHSSALPLTATIGALGVVYGDIGTSPLYALKEAAKAATHHGGGQLTPEAILGVVSLILWALILIISLKYALLILRADNRGEGGIVALLALLSARNAKPGTWRAQLLIVGLIGAALLYGDGAITPAISVLSAIEGLKVDAPSLAPAVVPLTVVILIGLFLVQKKGAGFIGGIFGPVMLAWFLVLALLGIYGIVKSPGVLVAISPYYAFNFLIHQNFHISFAILGAAFLAVTGGEAMYADMGHFGRVPIRLAWFAIALPALVLNYFGQAALLITDPTAIENPFYQLAPDVLHYPLVAFATVAAVIASQAIISGVFSLTQQAIQLTFLPRMKIVHTTSHAMGQIYVPLVNWLLAAATLGAVIGFGTSDALAGAYGIAVSLLMAITTLLAALVALQWGYHPAIVIPVNGFFFIIDCIFFAANSTKFLEGGWFPLVLAGIVAFLMLTWRSGVRLVESARGKLRQPEEDLIETAVTKCHARLPGTAVFLASARQRRAAGTDPIRQAQPRPASARRAGHRADRGIAAHSRRRSCRGYRDHSRHHPGHPALRLHAVSDHLGRPEACLRARQAARHRSHRHHLLHRPRDHHPQGRYPRHVGMARNRVRVPAAQRHAHRRVFWRTDRPGGGVRDGDRDLASVIAPHAATSMSASPAR